MHRSFVLLFLVQLSTCLGLSGALSLPERILVARSPINVPSKTYRKTAQSHHYAYQVNRQDQVVGRVRLPKHLRQVKGAAAIAVAKTDADHILEKQFVLDHLKKHVSGFNELHDLPRKVQWDLTQVVNSAKNLAPIAAGINRGKGAVTKHALKGKSIKENKLRNSYMIVTYPTARMVAQQVDGVYKKWNIKTTMTAEEYLRMKFVDARLLDPKRPEPAASVDNSPQALSAKRKGKRKASPPGSPTPKGRHAAGTTLGLKKGGQGSSANAGASGSSTSGSPPRKKGRTNTGASAKKRS